MNRSMLIILCDFLLVSLVAFSDFSAPHDEDPTPVVDPSSPPSNTAREDLVNSLQLALQDEQQYRERLNAELSQTRTSIEGQQLAVAEREAALQKIQANLQQTAAEARRLEQERALLRLQMGAAQTNLQSLQTALSATRSEAKLSIDQTEALKIALRQQQEDAEAMRKKMAELEKTQNIALAAKQELSAKLQVVEAEKRLTTEQLSSMRSEVETVRTEKEKLQASTTKLAEGVTALAEKSTALTKEIRENRPLTANVIFDEFTKNRLESQLETTRGGVFGLETKKEKTVKTILISDGAKIYALYHVADTPLSFWPADLDWRSLGGVIARNYFSYPLSSVAFLNQDPRIMVAPIDDKQAQQLGSKVYRISPEPFKFGEAVLVGATDGYYGECRFQLDLATPGYVRMDRSFFRGLFGKFNPSSGDVVLSKTGELLGIMVNNEYCVVLDKITPGISLVCGDTLREQAAGLRLNQLHNIVVRMPQKLQ